MNLYIFYFGLSAKILRNVNVVESYDKGQPMSYIVPIEIIIQNCSLLVLSNETMI